MSFTEEVVPVVLADVFAVSRLLSSDSKSTRISLNIVKVFAFFSSVKPPGSRELTLVLIKVAWAVTCREYDIIVDIKNPICVDIASDIAAILKDNISLAIVSISVLAKSRAIKIIKLKAFCKNTSTEI